jgi:hypothetical membrane protein
VISTSLLEPTRPGRADRRGSVPRATWFAVAGVGWFFVAAFVTGALTSGYDVRREAISGLSAQDSPHAWLMVTGFLLGGPGLVAAALVLGERVPQRAGRVAAALVATSGVLIAVAGIARQDCSDQLPSCRDFGEALEASSSYWVHQYASLLAFLLLIASSFVLARGLRRDGRRRLAVTSRLVGLASLAVLVLLVVSPAFVVDGYGVVQRIFVAGLFGWPLTAGYLVSRP